VRVLRTALLLLIAVELGFFVRWYHVGAAGFPLNDGGLFDRMVEEIRRAHYALPRHTSYNSASIPFAYPPLALYAAAILADVTHREVIDVLRVLPLAVSTLTIPAFFLLARAMVREERTAVYATFAFALLPRAFSWEIAGGGLTRAPGFLFALLALHQGYLLWTRRAWRFVPLTVLFAGLALLCHPEMGGFALFSLALLFAAYGRTRQSVWQAAVAVAGMAAVTAPWWATALVRHGAAPLLSAAGTGGAPGASLLRLAVLDITGEPFAGVFAVLGLVGALSCLADRRFVLPAWLLAAFVLDPRKAPTVAMAPLAMLIAICLTGVILPRIEGTAGRLPSEWLGRLLPKALLGYLLLWGIAMALAASLDEHSPLHALTAEERETMAWVAASTPPDSRFLVVTGREPWIDAVSEWFPALAGRVSVATVQGSEWLGRSTFSSRVEANKAAQRCVTDGAACIEAWVGRYHDPVTHVYIPRTDPAEQYRYVREGRDCCGALRIALRQSADYEVLYDGAGGTVFARRR
jgi:hypothetical protein